MKIAYSGIEGSFADIAVSYLDPEAERIPYRTFAKAYQSVQDGENDLALLPIENSYAGEVGQVTDLLFFGDLIVTGVYELPVVHCLLGTQDADTETVKTVISHPQALEQCGAFIAKWGYHTVSSENTARAAKEVAKNNDKTQAAIASRETAKLYGLKILMESINDSADNTTRFAALKKADPNGLSAQDEVCYNTGETVNSILMFTVRHESGTLARALSVLGDFGYNMRVIRSRPLRNKNWDYYFYIEAEGNINTRNGKMMLQELSALCAGLKLVGTYH